MQPVSAAYQTEIKATVRKIATEAKIYFVDNLTVGSSITPVANELDAVGAPKELPINLVTTAAYKFALADTDQVASRRMFADGTLFPVDGPSMAWIGSKLSDASGDIGTGGEEYELQYASVVSIDTVSWNADAHMGLPVDFEVQYDIGAGWVSLVTVTDYSDVFWQYEISPTLSNLSKIKIIITKVSIPGTRAKLIEFSPGLLLDLIETDRLVSWEVVRESDKEDATNPVGNASIAECTVVLDNTDGAFYRGSGSIYSALLTSNRRIEIKAGVEFEDETIEVVALGVFYSISWITNEDGTVTVRGWGLSKLMNETEHRGGALLADQKISELLSSVVTDYDADIGSAALIDTTDETIEWAFFSPSSHWNTIRELAAGDGGYAYISELDQFVYKARDTYTGTPTADIEITDTDNLISISEEWEQSKLTNKITVQGNPLQEQAQEEIFNLTESVTVPGSSNKTITAFYNKTPIKDPQTPVLVGHADITVNSTTDYAWGMSIVLANANVAAQDVTKITIQGDPMTREGNIRAVAEDATSQGVLGVREMEVSSDFIQKLSQAEAVAAAMLAVLKDPGSLRQISMRGMPELQIGDVLNLVDINKTIDADFWLIKHTLTYDGGLIATATVLEV